MPKAPRPDGPGNIGGYLNPAAGCGHIVKLVEEMEMAQATTYEVMMQKDGKYQVIVRRPNAIEEHVSDFKTEEEAEVWAATRRVKL